jgi:hypothetical protein
MEYILFDMFDYSWFGITMDELLLELTKNNTQKLILIICNFIH